MRLIRGSKLSDEMIFQIVLSFANGLSATRSSDKHGINRHTVDRVYSILRRAISTLPKLDAKLKRPVISGSKNAKYPIIGISETASDRRFVIVRTVGFLTLAELNRVQYKPSLLTQKTVYDDLDEVTPPDMVLSDPKYWTQTVQREGAYLTKTIRKYISFSIKRQNLLYGISWKYYPLYQKEFEWRFNTRLYSSKERVEILMNLLQNRANSGLRE